MSELDSPIPMKEVNTVKSLAIPDEDRKAVRSDVGNKMTKKLHYITTAKQRTQTKKEKLLADPDLRRWHANVARGSPLTADVRLRRISHFCEVRNITPSQFAELGLKDLRKVSDLIEDHISWMEEQNHSPGYIDSTLTSLKSWLGHFEIEIRRNIKIRYSDRTPTLEGERVPNQEETREIFNRAPLRTAAMIALISKSGLRLQVLGNHNATDGLVLADMPDIAIQDSKAVCLTSPPMVTVRRTLSKARHQYFTFLTENGTHKILAYLNDRLARGETLTPDSALIAPDTSYRVHRGNNTGKKFLPTSKISHDIRKTLRPRFMWRPYVLRAYFDTQLLMSESRGKIAHDFRVFFMGHKGSMESKYTTNKGVLPVALIEEMRQAFIRSEELLDLEMQSNNTAQEQANANKTSTQPTQMVVSLDQVETLISQGWRFVGTLPKDKAIVEKNGSGL
ncbi:MAG: hypothetical protein WA799_02440 [Nitrosotalea sp.]